MRITESRLMQMSSASMAMARERAGRATESLSSGIRVERPSDDPVAWAQGARSKAALGMAGASGAAIGHAKDHLGETENALSSIQDALARVRDLAVQQANGGVSVDEQAQAANEVRALRGEILARLNTRSSTDGEYLFAGDRGDVPAFDAAGVFVGGASARRLELAPGGSITVAVSGASFTAAAGGPDLLGVLDGLARSLDAGDNAAVSAALDDIDAVSSKVSDARSGAGYQLNALDDAESSRSNLELQLQSMHARMVETDPIEAASELASAQTAFQTSGAVAQRILAMLEPR